MNDGKFQIGVIGAGTCDEDLYGLAEEVGGLIARQGWTLLCGGLGGVMEAAARGAAGQGGLTIGLLPGSNREAANPYIEAALPTGMGHARNAIIAQASDAVIAVGGGYGTLSEMALARKMGKPVVSLRSWEPAPDVIKAETPREAVARVVELLTADDRPADANP
jgi:uncharacterized protein (TIGR00725 family)